MEFLKKMKSVIAGIGTTVLVVIETLVNFLKDTIYKEPFYINLSSKNNHFKNHVLGSTCFEGDCCKNCQLRKVGSQCREAESECDLPEFCTGSDQYCPKNNYKQNGVYCQDREGMCFDGHCKTANNHCEFLWGSGAKSSEKCMKKINRMGRSFGYCKKGYFGGYNGCIEVRFKIIYHFRIIPLFFKEDAVCGKQICIGGNDEPIAKGYSYKKGYKPLETTEGFEDCKVVMQIFRKAEFDEADPDMVQNGVPCGENKMCILGKCHYKEEYFPPCPNNCSDTSSK